MSSEISERQPLITAPNIAVVINAVVWPIAIFILALIFRRNLRDALIAFGERTTKVSLAGVSIDFGQMSNASPVRIQLDFAMYGGPETIARPSSDGEISIPNLIETLRTGGT